MSKRTKKVYDKRSHDERIHDLYIAFETLSTEAIAANKKNIASAANVLAKANVNKTYFYASGGKIKDSSIQAKYDKVNATIKKFQHEFDDHIKSNSALAKAQAIASKEIERSSKLEGLLQQSLEMIAELQSRIKSLNDKHNNLEMNLLDATYSKTLLKQAASGNVVSIASAKVVSPDLHLAVNGNYTFDDIALREQAWELCERELEAVLQRPLPMRIYVLVGPPCAGKTTWRSEQLFQASDRHPVIIDATNLTQSDRLKWMLIIQQYVRTADIKTRVVVFHTREEVLISRNNQRELSKKMDERIILDKAKKMTWPDMKTEKFDEMEVIRYAGK